MRWVIVRVTSNVDHVCSLVNTNVIDEHVVGLFEEEQDDISNSQLLGDIAKTYEDQVVKVNSLEIVRHSCEGTTRRLVGCQSLHAWNIMAHQS